MQTQANLFGKVRQFGFIAREQHLDRQGHQHAIERALASALAQQVEQGAPAVGIGMGGVLGQEARHVIGQRRGARQRQGDGARLVVALDRS